MNRGRILSRLLTLGVAIAVVSNVALAIVSWRSASRHRAAAEATLDDFAGVALDRYIGTVESLLRQALMPAFGLLGYQQLARPGDGLNDLREMAEVPDVLAADPCNCVPVLRAEAWFRINLVDSSALVIDQARRPVAATPDWLAQVPARMAALSAEQFRFAGFVIEEPTCTRMVYATILRDSLGVARQIYGLSVFTSVVSREVFERAYDVTRLPPRFLSGETANRDYVTLTVSAPDGTLLYQSPVRIVRPTPTPCNWADVAASSGSGPRSTRPSPTAFSSVVFRDRRPARSCCPRGLPWCCCWRWGGWPGERWIWPAFAPISPRASLTNCGLPSPRSGFRPRPSC